MYIEEKLEDHVPQYRSVLVDDKVSRMIQVWQNEDKGLLIGKILEVGENKLSFQDFNNKEWNIILNRQTTTDRKHRVHIEAGEKIKIIGEKVSETDFKAFEIRPFQGKEKRKNSIHF